MSEEYVEAIVFISVMLAVLSAFLPLIVFLVTKAQKLAESRNTSGVNNSYLFLQTLDDYFSRAHTLTRRKSSQQIDPIHEDENNPSLIDSRAGGQYV